MTTFNWTIAHLERNSTDGGVVTAHWRVDATDGEYTAGSYGTAGFTADPEAPNFIPFEQLTEADVIGWLTAKEGWAEALEARLDADIERQKNPPVLHGLPWPDEEVED